MYFQRTYNEIYDPKEPRDPQGAPEISNCYSSGPGGQDYMQICTLSACWQNGTPPTIPPTDGDASWQPNGAGQEGSRDRTGEPDGEPDVITKPGNKKV